MNYKEAIDYIECQNNNLRQTDNTRMQKLMEGLGNPQDKLSFIHVAGTNGKGSCVASISSILINAGYKVGMFTSPHLIKYEERMMVNNKCISRNMFSQIASMVKDVTDKMEESPTVFEKLTAMAFIYFLKKKCDVVVLEVGLGGRLDATNVIKNLILSIIMNIGLEHTEVLGDTLEKIAFEKAGIIKENSDVVVYNNTKKVIDVFKEVAKKKNAKLTVVNFKNIKIKKESLKGQSFDYKDLKNIKLSLLGRHQFNNAAVCIEAIKLLNKKGYKISDEALRKGFIETKWEARLSVLNKRPLFILDGAHNPQCAESLKDSLPIILKDKKAIILCGMLKDKDYNSVMDMMIPFAKEFVCLTPFSSRALKAEELANVLKAKGQIATCANSIEDGIALALTKAHKNGAILAFGSLYLAGYIVEKFPIVYQKWNKK